MKWLTQLRTYLGHESDNVISTHPLDPEGATKAYENAKEGLNQARKHRHEAEEIRSSLSILNRSNHYGEAIMLSMMPKEKRS